MDTRKGRNAPWRVLRAHGYQRCVYSVRKSHAKKDGFPGTRTGVQKRGTQCNKHVSPEHRKERGIAICTDHWPIFQEEVAIDAARRQHIRDKYDPGPLYDTEEWG